MYDPHTDWGETAARMLRGDREELRQSLPTYIRDCIPADLAHQELPAEGTE